MCFEQKTKKIFVLCTKYNYICTEKALCDVINFSKCLNLRFMKDVETYLEEDIRFDTGALAGFDIMLLERCALASRRQSSINMLIKYIKHVRHL